MSASTSTDILFSTLPPSVQRRIDNAFAQAYYADFPPSPLNVSEGNDANAGGGFLPPSPQACQGGGFLPPSPPPARAQGGGFLPPSPSSPGSDPLHPANKRSKKPRSKFESTPTKPTPAHLPLRLVPSALRLLSLPPDDAEILAVFSNAAGGWARPGIEVRETSGREAEELDQENERGEQHVALADWRSVCAVLLEDADPGSLPAPFSDPASAPISADEDQDMHDLDEEGSDSDEYTGMDVSADRDEDALSSPLSSPSGSSDEFHPPHLPSASKKDKGKGRGKGARTRRTADVDKSRTLTSAQRAAALSSFALFFPDAGAESDAEDPETSSFSTRRLRLVDIQRAAQVLGEKIKAEEMHDMLTLFSSAPDGSMSFDDFTRMMLAADLV